MLSSEHLATVRRVIIQKSIVEKGEKSTGSYQTKLTSACFQSTMFERRETADASQKTGHHFLNLHFVTFVNLVYVTKNMLVTE